MPNIITDADGARWLQVAFLRDSGAACTFMTWARIPDWDDEYGLGRRWRAEDVEQRVTCDEDTASVN